ncbi:MAG TPA: tetratricopeptide repeat protein [Candidatus Dormibacteraeota bacterium]|nr:tetratricopeptide repeat protein [Candidatus Dormibacteraeota bacterium]
MVSHVPIRISTLILATLVFLHPSPARAQQTTHRVSNAIGSQIYLAFPFENAGTSSRLDWLGEGLEELTILRLSAAGEAVYSHTGRINELDRYGLPPGAKLSRATMLRIAEDLDVDYVVFGSFTSDGSKLTVESRLLRVNPPALLPAITETGPLDSLMDLQTRLAWRSLSSNDRSYPLSLAEFAKKQRPLRLDAFEHYVRGLLAGEDEVRIREFKDAARLDPAWPEPDFWLGEVYFSRRDCNSALPWYARIPKQHDRYAESVFAVGVCRLLLSQPDLAQEVFTSLRESLRESGSTEHGDASAVAGGDLPEILNNLALAKARLGDATGAQTDLQRAADLDPDEDDYPVNLGLLALQANDPANAAEYFREATEREPDNPEDRALLIYSLDKSGKQPEAQQERQSASEMFGPSGLPAIHLDSKSDTLTHMARIKTELDTTTLRQEIKPAELINAGTSAPSADTAENRIRRARQELSSGHVEAARADFQAALSMDSTNTSAHRGLADIARRQGKLDEAVLQLQAALQSRDNAVVRVALARVYLEQKKPAMARTEVQRALKLAPNYTEAKELLARLQSPSPTGGTND